MSQQALAELLRGKGAHADPLACVEDLAFDLAQRHIDDFPHSIAELVFHMNYWMSYELNRIRGESQNIPSTMPRAFRRPSPADPEDWNRLKWDLAWFISEFAKLAQSSREELDRQIESGPRRRQESSRNPRGCPLANGHPQQLPHRPDRSTPPRPEGMAPESRRRHVVRRCRDIGV